MSLCFGLWLSADLHKQHKQHMLSYTVQHTCIHIHTYGLHSLHRDDVLHNPQSLPYMTVPPHQVVKHIFIHCMLKLRMIMKQCCNVSNIGSNECLYLMFHNVSAHQVQETMLIIWNTQSVHVMSPAKFPLQMLICSSSFIINRQMQLGPCRPLKVGLKFKYFTKFCVLFQQWPYSGEAFHRAQSHRDF